MSRQNYSKSGLFLLELLINLLLFSLLCGYGLMFFTKSNNLTQDTTTLHQAVRITSSIASIYESGDGSYAPLCAEYEHAVLEDDVLYIYFDANFQPCDSSDYVYYTFIENLKTPLNKIRISFYDIDGNLSHAIVACYYAPSTLGNVREDKYE
jgi:hypothetical protein